MAQDHRFRVRHGHTGNVAYEGESFIEACNVQYRENRQESAVGYEPLWTLWIIDADDNAMIVKTQL